MLSGEKVGTERHANPKRVSKPRCEFSNIRSKILDDNRPALINSHALTHIDKQAVVARETGVRSDTSLARMKYKI